MNSALGSKNIEFLSNWILRFIHPNGMSAFSMLSRKWFSSSSSCLYLKFLPLSFVQQSFSDITPNQRINCVYRFSHDHKSLIKTLLPKTIKISTFPIRKKMYFNLIAKRFCAFQFSSITSMKNLCFVVVVHSWLLIH